MASHAPRRARLLLALLSCHIVVMGALYGSLFLPIASDGIYAPYWTDEYGYLTDAKSFAQNGTIHRVRVLEESTATLGHAGSHGFAYALIQGSILRPAGQAPYSLIVTNVIAVLLAVGLVLATRMSVTQRLMIGPCC